MSLLIRRGTDAERQTITPLESEPIFTTDYKQLWMGDNSTPGGILIGGDGAGLQHLTASGTDNYTATAVNYTAYADGDAFLVRFTNGNGDDSDLNINGLGAIPLYSNHNGQIKGGEIQDNSEMLVVYNASSPAYFKCLGTSPNSLFAYVHNADSVSITRGQPVYAFGATGNRMSVKLAYNTSDATSAQTVGLVYSDTIAAGDNGYVIIQGTLDGLNLGSYTDGDPLYLGSTAGTITDTKPYAPNHLVYLGVVERANPGNGIMYVRVQNGYELEELHDVDLVTTPPVDGDVLTYDAYTGLWVPAAIPPAGVTSVSGSSPIASSGGTTPTISIADAIADGSTKGAATFTANDFNSASGVISIDYTNGQSASGSNKGFLTSADWTTFNSKQAALGFTPENVVNKSTTTTLGTSNTLYPTQNAVKTYVDNEVQGPTVGSDLYLFYNY